MSKTQKLKQYQAFPAMAETENHSKDIESGAPDWYNSVTDKTNRKGASRYLPTGIDCGCDAVHIPELRHILWQTLRHAGL